MRELITLNYCFHDVRIILIRHELDISTIIHVVMVPLVLVDDHASFSIVDNDLGVNDRKIGSNGQQLHKRSAMALGVVARVVLGVARLLGWAIFIASARAGAASGLPRLATSTRSVTTATTGFTGFAECRLHSAKASLPSANSLPSVTLGKRHSAKTLPRALALGKAATWRHPGPALCRVPNGGHSAKFQTLPSVGVWHLAKCRPRVAPRGRFAECWILALGKRLKLCRVPGF